MSAIDDDFIRLLIAIKDYASAIAKAIQDYLDSKGRMLGQIEEFKALFSDDTRRMLSFELTEDGCKVTPLRYLGNRAFAEVSSVVETKGGKRMGRGREAYWLIPYEPKGGDKGVVNAEG